MSGVYIVAASSAGGPLKCHRYYEVINITVLDGSMVLCNENLIMDLHFVVDMQTFRYLIT